MSIITEDKKQFPSIGTEFHNHIPRSFQMMLEIEEQADATFKQILEDIESGKTTLEQVMKERGLLQ
ncbi:MAG: hypothetical protein AWU59_840 [Methanolobus sp. T82-4]|nr:MAG: hypothetical protein AWU59_840 [Methanolobus sp. T82-4]